MVKLEPVTGGIGAEVSGVDFSRPIGQELADTLRQALDQHLVLFVRGQTIDRARQKGCDRQKHAV